MWNWAQFTSVSCRDRDGTVSKHSDRMSTNFAHRMFKGMLSFPYRYRAARSYFSPSYKVFSMLHGVHIYLKRTSISDTHLSTSISRFCERPWMVGCRVYFIFIIVVSHIAQEWRRLRKSLTYCKKRTLTFNELEIELKSGIRFYGAVFQHCVWFSHMEWSGVCWMCNSLSCHEGFSLRMWFKCCT